MALHAESDPASAALKVKVPAAYTSLPLNLKQLPPMRQVEAIRACGDTYYVKTGDNQTRVFWDRNLRFRTDASTFGPAPGTPAILPTGMMGDRASVVFALPGDISAFIQQRC